MNNKIEELKKEILKNNYDFLIIKLLNKGSLNSLIDKITDIKTKITVTSLHKKEFLSGNEQFLDLLSKFIYIFKEDFYFLNNNFDSIVEILLQNEQYTEYLLCKKYIGNNDNLDFFSFNIKRMIVYGFYNNIKKLHEHSKIIAQFAINNKIDIKNDLINDMEGINILYEALLKMSICNVKEFNIVLLFEDIEHYDKQSNKIYKIPNLFITKHYIIEWEKMIKNYYTKKEATDILLK